MEDIQISPDLARTGSSDHVLDNTVSMECQENSITQTPTTAEMELHPVAEGASLSPPTSPISQANLRDMQSGEEEAGLAPLALPQPSSAVRNPLRRERSPSNLSNSALKRRRLQGPFSQPEGKVAEKEGKPDCTFAMTLQEKAAYFDRLQEIYMDQSMCDVVLRVGSVEFPAHRSVLIGHRCFLQGMLESGMRESSQAVIDLDEADPNLFRYVLDYLYGRPIDLCSTDIIAILELASRYQVEGLAEQACDALATHLDSDNCSAVYAAADHYSRQSLREQAFQKIVTNFAVVCQTEGFRNLDYRLVVSVIGSDQILDCDEALVFDAAGGWLAHAHEERAQFIGPLMELVRFPLMDARYLSDVIKYHHLMRLPETIPLLLEAFEHQALIAAGRPDGHPGAMVRTSPRRRSCGFKNSHLLTEHSDAVSALTVFEDKLISGSWDTTIKVWDPESWTCERTLSDHSGTIRVLFTCKNKVLSGSDDNMIKVWNPESWTLVRTLTDHTDAVNTMAYCKGRLVSGSDDGTIKLWDTTTWICEVTVHQRDGVLALAVCGEKLVSGSDACMIKIWDTTTWTCKQEFKAHSDEIWGLTVCGNKLVSASVDCSLKVWDPDTWEMERKLDDHQGPVYAITCLEDKLVSASSDETIKVWNMDWECERTQNCEGVWALVVYKNRLVSGSDDNSIKIWV